MTAEEKQKAEIIRLHVNNMIDKTFEKLNRIYENNQEGGKTAQVIDGCRLIFPLYRSQTDDKLKIRISEQELRFAFVDVFHRYCDLEGLSWFYSIETPTKQKYIFSNTDNQKPQIANDAKEGGRSASFDFVIHDEKLNRICLIEFKANNPNPFNHQKDFLKLIEDPRPETTEESLNQDLTYPDNIQRYFIEIVGNYDEGTIKSLADKIKDYKANGCKIQSEIKEGNEPEIIFHFYSIIRHETITKKVLALLKA